DETIEGFKSSYGDQRTGGWNFINTDGVVKLELGSATAGGVMRDENDDWGFGYNQFLGKCLIFDTELWGILDDLKIIQQRGNDKVIIQSDSLRLLKHR
ncbi:hypothetical protein Golob_007317, partial [Gossypium lobatum]|nr:hypothetical protein [Gossypium lobatum]